MSASRVEENTCFNCGGPADTKDHVVPKGIFPKSPNAELITVPACAKCNNATSMDEEYFRLVLSMHWIESEAQQEVWSEKAYPSLIRRDGLRKMVLNQARALVLPKDGKFHETALVKLDSARMDRVARKIVSGLYYHLLVSRLTDQAKFKFYWQPKEWAEDIALKAAGLNLDPRVFTVRYGVASDGATERSIWWMRFYRSIMYVVTVEIPLQRSAPPVTRA